MHLYRNYIVAQYKIYYAIAQLHKIIYYRLRYLLFIYIMYYVNAFIITWSCFIICIVTIEEVYFVQMNNIFSFSLNYFLAKVFTFCQTPQVVLTNLMKFTYLHKYI